MHQAKKVFLLTFLFAACSAHAQDQVMRIWPGLAPGSDRVEDREQWVDDREVFNVYQPELTLFLPDHSEGQTPAVIVLPGGGYQKVVMEKEGYKVARWLNEHGIAAFVLKYRLDRGAALSDAQRAVSLVRQNAEIYGIDKYKIGVMGFSAGAHLAGNLVKNHHDRESYDTVDDISARPDFWVGVYGGYGDIFQGTGKSDNLPPVFLVHAGDDSRVPAMNSVELYTQFSNSGVLAELHVYERGEHGFALEKDRGPAVTSTVTDWSSRLLAWLEMRGILDTASASTLSGDASKYTIDNTVNTFDMENTVETEVGYQYWFADKKLADGKTLKLSVVGPGKATHAPHQHSEDEFFFVLEGTAEFHLDGRAAVGGPMTSFYCPTGAMHGIRNIGDTELKYLVIKKYILD